MNTEIKKVNEYQVSWQGRQLWVDVYAGGTWRVSLPDGRELRMWRTKEEGWKGFPELNIVPEIGRQIDLHEQS